jgi:hypothetical protein
MLNRTEYANPQQESSFELLSVYINEYRELDDDERRSYEHEIQARRLPLPLPSLEEFGTAREETQATAAHKKSSVDRETFVAYIFLLYLLTGAFFAWYYLARRLIMGDIMKGTRHKIILTLISIGYVVAEVLLLDRLFSA